MSTPLCPTCHQPLPVAIEPPPEFPEDDWAKDFQFTGTKRDPKTITEVIVHESVTGSVDSTIAVLKRRNYGVHFLIGPTGEIVQSADLLDRLIHAGGHNGPSIGVEIVNRYYPEGGKARLPWNKVIKAPWADDGADQVRDYVLPTVLQMEGLVELLQWLSTDSGLSIPMTWPGVFPTGGGGRKIRMGQLPDGGQKRIPGIWAHQYSAHADGAFPVLVAWLALELGRPVSWAYTEAEKLATGAGAWISLP